MLIDEIKKELSEITSEIENLSSEDEEMVKSKLKEKFLDFKFYYLPLSINLLLVFAGFVSNIFFNIFIDNSAYIFNLNSL